MRWPRAGIVVGLIGLVLLGAGWWLAAVGAAGPERNARPVAAVRPPSESLLGQLQQWLAHPGRTRVPVPRFAPQVHGSTCFVAAGRFCSITPCVVPVATVPAQSCRAAIAPSRAMLVGRP